MPLPEKRSELGKGLTAADCKMNDVAIAANKLCNFIPVEDLPTYKERGSPDDTTRRFQKVLLLERNAGKNGYKTGQVASLSR